MKRLPKELSIRFVFRHTRGDIAGTGYRNVHTEGTCNSNKITTCTHIKHGDMSQRHVAAKRPLCDLALHRERFFFCLFFFVVVFFFVLFFLFLKKKTRMFWPERRQTKGLTNSTVGLHVRLGIFLRADSH